MIEVRIHGRGGQGNVVAAYLLATAAFHVGKHCQAFPNFGAERRGAPVTAFVRIAETPILRRNQVLAPDFLIVQDHGLLAIPGTAEGLKPGGGIVVNAHLPSPEIEAATGRPTVAFPAAQLAQATLGKPVPNVALLAAFLTVTGLLPLDALVKAVAERFKGEVLERNVKLIHEAAQAVPADLWKEAAHA